MSVIKMAPAQQKSVNNAVALVYSARACSFFYLSTWVGAHINESIQI